MSPGPRTTPGGASEAAVAARTDSGTGKPSQALLGAVEARDGASGADTDLLPPPSPAFRVHEAAARLRGIAEAALADLNSSDFWACYDRATAWRDGFENAFGGVCSELAGVFTPELAVELADWLDTVASAAARRGEPLPPFALAVARALAPTAPITEGAPS